TDRTAAGWRQGERGRRQAEDADEGRPAGRSSSSQECAGNGISVRPDRALPILAGQASGGAPRSRDVPRRKGGHVKLRTLLASLAILVLSTGIAFAATQFQVTTGLFDPAKTFLVQAQWLDGIGCNSPLATVTAASAGWLRLRWTSAQLLAAGIATNAQVKSITIVFDEGQDTGPDNFGLAVLDNIDVNGTLTGAGQSSTKDHGK